MPNIFHGKGTKLDVLFLLFIAFFLLTLYTSCRPAYKSVLPQYKKLYTGQAAVIPDYSQLKYWAAHPQLKDLSDSIPAGLRNETRDSSADVFFIYPTTFLKHKRNTVIRNADIENAELNAKTDYSTILYQASVFNGSCRIYAPRYRQAHISAFFSKDTLQSTQAFNIAYSDVKTAFQYYLAHENKGRPIIIAAHSQGTLHAARLIKEFFEAKPLSNQLVVAYLWGMPIPPNYFQQISLCNDSLKTNCIVGWRLYKKGYFPKYIRHEPYTSWVINPLSWNTDSAYFPSTYHKGAVLFGFNKVYNKTHGAKIYKGVVWIDKPRFPFSFLYTRRNYHAGDINLFYLDIRKNIALRIKYFLNTH